MPFKGENMNNKSLALKEALLADKGLRMPTKKEEDYVRMIGSPVVGDHIYASLDGAYLCWKGAGCALGKLTDWSTQNIFASDLPVAKKIAAGQIWKRLGNVPIDNQECLDEPFGIFRRGTSREDVWRWFEDTFDVSVVDDLMFSDKRESVSPTL